MVTVTNGRPSVVLPTSSYRMRSDCVLSVLKYEVSCVQSASLRSAPGLKPKASSGEVIGDCAHVERVATRDTKATASLLMSPFVELRRGIEVAGRKKRGGTRRQLASGID